MTTRIQLLLDAVVAEQEAKQLLNRAAHLREEADKLLVLEEKHDREILQIRELASKTARNALQAKLAAARLVSNNIQHPIEKFQSTTARQKKAKEFLEKNPSTLDLGDFCDSLGCLRKNQGNMNRCAIGEHRAQPVLEKMAFHEKITRYEELQASFDEFMKLVSNAESSGENTV